MDDRKTASPVVHRVDEDVKTASPVAHRKDEDVSGSSDDEDILFVCDQSFFKGGKVVEESALMVDSDSEDIPGDVVWDDAGDVLDVDVSDDSTNTVPLEDEVSEGSDSSDSSIVEPRRSSRISKRKGIFTYNEIGGKPSVDVIT